jgi:cryptochrome
VFVLDPWFVKKARVGPNRWRFLYESLHDLNRSLIKKNSKLILLRGQPSEVFKKKFIDWKINLLCFESDTEPYAKERDAHIRNIAGEMNVSIVTKCSHTLYDPEVLYAKNGNKVALTYQSFVNLIAKVGAPDKPLPESKVKQFEKLTNFVYSDEYELPKSLQEMGVDDTKCGSCLYPGGETEALSRVKLKFSNENWICTFEKPNTSPNSLAPSTTVLRLVKKSFTLLKIF